MGEVTRGDVTSVAVKPGGITTHVLDTSRGRPAAGVAVRLERWQAPAWTALGNSRTDGDGRCRDLLAPPVELEAGRYRLVFDTAAYFAGLALPAFFPEVALDFTVGDASAHYHVPLLLAPHGYTTYRGS